MLASVKLQYVAAGNRVQVEREGRSDYWKREALQWTAAAYLDCVQQQLTHMYDVWPSYDIAKWKILQNPFASSCGFPAKGMAIRRAAFGGRIQDEAGVMRIGRPCDPRPRSDEHGQRYTVDFDLEAGPRNARIRSCWIVRTGEDFARLTTCYVL